MRRTDLFHQRHPDCQLTQLKGVYMWVIDRELRIVDITPAALEAAGETREFVLKRTIEEIDPVSNIGAEARIYRLRRIFETGEPDTLMLWEKLPAPWGWTKIVMSTSLLDEDYTLTVAHDLTDTDPRAHWLRALRLKRKVMVLGEAYDDAEVSFNELRVLRGLLFNRPHKLLADDLGISESTISYRTGRLKLAFKVDTVPKLLQEISTNGLIYLLSIDDGHPIVDELELFRKATPEFVD
jgi:hypothetical protein